MPKIIRLNGKLGAFASEALGTERTIFGAEAQSNDLTDQITALFKRGWGHVSPSDAPTLQDFNALGFTTTQLLAYLHQMGVPEYNEQQDYYSGSVVTYSGALYISLADDNTGNIPGASGSEDKWKDLNEAHVEAVPNSIMKRDANGRAQVAAPSANEDIANKQYVDEVGSSLPLLATLWDNSSLPKDGYLSAIINHGLLPRSTFPEAAAEIQRRFDAGDTAVVTDAVWLAEFTASGVCNRFSIGDGSTTFRIPYIPGLYPGAARGGENAGDYLVDTIRPLNGAFNPILSYTAGASEVGGVFSRSVRTSTGVVSAGSNGASGYNLIFDAASQVAISDVVRPRTAVMTPFIKMYGAVTDAGEANIAALIALTTELNGRVYLVDSWRSADDLSWYRKYSDGWVEQGGFASRSGTGESKINFMVPFSNTNYYINGSTSTNLSAHIVQIVRPSGNYFTAYFSNDLQWFACGRKA